MSAQRPPGSNLGAVAMPLPINGSKYVIALGEVRAGRWLLDPVTGEIVDKRGRTLTALTGVGYPSLTLDTGSNRTTILAHRLIWEFVHGPIPQGMQINHINGVKTDNRIENLELVTPAENIAHAVRTGLMKRKGEHNPAAKLTEDDVRDIRARYAAGESPAALGQRYGISRTNAYRVAVRQTWTSVA